jgi:enoyl-[acyl-carrier protein] reductase I
MNPLYLDGKTALVTGVLDDASFAWHIAKTLHAAGARVILSCHPRAMSIVEHIMTRDKYKESRALPWGQGSFIPLDVLPCDLAIDSEGIGKDPGAVDISILGLKQALLAKDFYLDIVVHSVAFSPEIRTSHLDVSRAAYLETMNVSSYSLISLTRTLLPIINSNAAFLALSYIASERVIPMYGGGMASAKAALECDVRMLSWFLGEHGHRINAISAGPYPSRAARAAGDIKAMANHVAARSPLRRPIDAYDVAKAALFLCGDLSSGVTGEVLHVDCGFHVMAI